MYWTPTVCWVQPTEYIHIVVRSRPELAQIASATCRNWSGLIPQTCDTISGV